jgi:hypothetical protein
LVRDDGKSYEGGYVHDKKEGYGVFKWQDGRVYKGGWSNGIQHGDGLFFAPSEDEKRGVWHNGELTKWVDADGNEILEAPRKDSGHV